MRWKKQAGEAEQVIVMMVLFRICYYKFTPAACLPIEIDPVPQVIYNFSRATATDV